MANFWLVAFSRVAAVVGRGFFSALTIHDSRFTILLDVFLVAVGRVSVKDFLWRLF